MNGDLPENVESIRVVRKFNPETPRTVNITARFSLSEDWVTSHQDVIDGTGSVTVTLRPGVYEVTQVTQLSAACGSPEYVYGLVHRLRDEGTHEIPRHGGGYFLDSDAAKRAAIRRMKAICRVTRGGSTFSWWEETYGGEGEGTVYEIYF